MASPPPPENVVATVNANDSISLEWTFDPTWFAFDGTDDSLGGFNEGMWYPSGYGFRVHQKSDSSSWQQQADLAPEYHLDLSRTEVPLTTDKTLSATGGTFLVEFELDSPNSGIIGGKYGAKSMIEIGGDGGLNCETDANGNFFVPDEDPKIPTGEPVWLAVRFDNREADWFINGDYYDVSNYGFDPITDETRTEIDADLNVDALGGHGYENPMDGRFIRATWYDRALTEAEILHWSGGGKPSTPSVNYDLNEGSGDTITDSVSDEVSTTADPASTSWNGPFTPTFTATSLTQNTSYDFYVETYTEHAASSSSTSSAETFLNELRSAASHSAISNSSAKRVLSISESVTSSSNSMTSQSRRVLNLLETVSSALSGGSSQSDRGPFTGVRANGSHSNQLSSDSIRVTSLFESVGSHSNALRSRSKRVVSLLETASSALSGGSSRSDRGPFTGVRAGSSHSRGSFTTVFNDRTSLELLDYPLEWDDGEVAWYTDWFSESKILGSEDTLAIRGMVVPGAKEPAATVYVEYDADGNGNPDAVSDPVDTGHNEAIHTVEGIPLDEGGWYRLKITNHSGYNELYSLDLGMVH